MADASKRTRFNPWISYGNNERGRSRLVRCAVVIFGGRNVDRGSVPDGSNLSRASAMKISTMISTLCDHRERKPSSNKMTYHFGNMKGGDRIYTTRAMDVSSEAL
jgi:hypothetical protein